MQPVAQWLSLLWWERVPVLLALLVVVLPFLAKSAARGMLEGAFELEAWQFLLFAVCQLLLSASIIEIADNIRYVARSRFGAEWIPTTEMSGLVRVPLFAALSAPAFIVAVLTSRAQNSLQWPMALGLLLVAALILFGIYALSAKLAEGLAGGGTAATWVSDWLGPGYFDQDTGQLIVRHKRAIAGTFAAVLFYAVVLALGWFGRYPPALVSVLALLGVLGWFAAGASVFFDYTRFPFTWLFLAGLWGWTQWCPVDHLSPVRARAVPVSLATVPDLVATAPARNRIVVVAAEGGGIHLAAWTAEVLSRLTSEFPDDDASRGFGQNLRLISGVSGGAVGSMQYLQARLRADLDPNWPARLRTVARSSSLDAVIWGFAGPDTVRTMVPLLRTQDRGAALERQWLANAGAESERDQAAQSLVEWSQLAAAGKLPAIIFNTTQVSGTPLPISTCAIPGLKSLLELADVDVNAVTAARLAAGFPYVSPAARPALIQDGRVEFLPGVGHLVDGGYFDNQGVWSALEWVRVALDDPTVEVRLLLIQGRPSGPPPTDPQKRGFFYQLLAPVQAVLGVRGQSQRQRNRNDLEHLAGQWKGRFAAIRFEFQGPDEEAPLSWHLTRRQKVALEENWKHASITKARQELAAFLR